VNPANGFGPTTSPPSPNRLSREGRRRDPLGYESTSTATCRSSRPPRRVTGGTNDLALGAHWDDLWLFEGQVRTRVLSEVLSGTLQVRFQVYNYVAFLARYGAEHLGRSSAPAWLPRRSPATRRSPSREEDDYARSHSWPLSGH
jgi:hypothetical protein